MPQSVNGHILHLDPACRWWLAQIIGFHDVHGIERCNRKMIVCCMGTPVLRVLVLENPTIVPWQFFNRTRNLHCQKILILPRTDSCLTSKRMGPGRPASCGIGDGVSRTACTAIPAGGWMSVALAGTSIPAQRLWSCDGPLQPCDCGGPVDKGRLCILVALADDVSTTHVILALDGSGTLWSDDPIGDVTAAHPASSVACPGGAGGHHDPQSAPQAPCRLGQTQDAA